MARGLRADERIERYAARIDAKLRADEQARDRMAVIARSSLRRVLKDCGYTRLGPRNVVLIQDALVRRDVHPDPPLTTPGLDREERIVFTRTPPAERHARSSVGFPTERDLETFLVANFDALFPGLSYHGRQFQVQTGRNKTGKVDILAGDHDGYVVIELKLDRPSDDIVFAVDKYMDGVAAWVEKRGGQESVRGLVISGHVDERMREKLDQLAAVDGRRIDWWQYEIDLKMNRTAAPAAGRSLHDNGEPWTEAGVANPQSPGVYAKLPKLTDD